MEIPKDVYLYLINFVDDVTALKMLSVNKKFSNELEHIFKKRYPHVVISNKSWRQRFGEMIKFKDYMRIKYSTGGNKESKESLEFKAILKDLNSIDLVDSADMYVRFYSICRKTKKCLLIPMLGELLIFIKGRSRNHRDFIYTVSLYLWRNIDCYRLSLDEFLKYTE